MLHGSQSLPVLRRYVYVAFVNVARSNTFDFTLSKGGDTFSFRAVENLSKFHRNALSLCSLKENIRPNYERLNTDELEDQKNEIVSVALLW